MMPTFIHRENVFSSYGKHWILDTYVGWMLEMSSRSLVVKIVLLRRAIDIRATLKGFAWLLVVR